jgi:DNA-binding transcriptional ArsR family regulator
LTCDHLVTYYRRIGSDDDDVFKALADGGRRQLLDTLFGRDGRSLGELCDVLPAMTRFGVMKHLAVLEDAKLVVTEKVGRTKLHYLNPIPIQEIHQRWISKYAAPTVAAMVGLRSQLESREPA